MRGKISEKRDIDTHTIITFESEIFWQKMRILIREELLVLRSEEKITDKFHTPGLRNKPLYKIKEVIEMFDITRPTIYEWIKSGKLKPVKIRSRVFFLWEDLHDLIKNSKTL